VLAVDRGTLGVLDDRDLMMHTLFDSPHEQAIGETSYADKPLSCAASSAEWVRHHLHRL
jgi:hypothetical protein